MTKCESCRFWWRFNESNKGECRRYAPRVTLLGSLNVTREADNGDIVSDRYVDASDDAPDLTVERQWPETFSDDWCGEHELRKEQA